MAHTRLLATLAVLAALAAPSTATAVVKAGATTSTFPVPASARIHPSTSGSTVAPGGAATSGGGAVAPSGTTTPGAVSPVTTTPAAAAPGAVAPVTTTPAAAAPGAVAPVTTTPATQSVPSEVLGTAVLHKAAKPAASSKLSTPAIVAVILAALLALGCAMWGIARMQAYEPRWTLSLRHAFAEAGFRASATWAEFGDWARLGR